MVARKCSGPISNKFPSTTTYSTSVLVAVQNFRKRRMGGLPGYLLLIVGAGRVRGRSRACLAFGQRCIFTTNATRWHQDGDTAIRRQRHGDVAVQASWHPRIYAEVNGRGCLAGLSVISHRIGLRTDAVHILEYAPHGRRQAPVKQLYVMAWL